jgi:SOS-response transcriptional repressor LexA
MPKQCTAIEARHLIYKKLRELQHLNGRPPTLRELARACGWRSATGVHRHLAYLTQIGLVRHTKGACGYMAVEP